MLSLRVKLFMAFAAVIVIALGLVGYTIQRSTERQFQSYLVENGNQWAGRTRNTLTAYYIRNRGWQGVEYLLVDMSRLSGGRLVLTDGSGRVIADSESQLTGGDANEEELGVPLALGPDIRRIGVLHVSAFGSSPLGPWSDWMQRQMREHIGASASTVGPGMMAPAVVPGSPVQGALGGSTRPAIQAQELEGDFLGRVRRSLWLSGLGAGAAALLLGLVLVRQITGPLRRLKMAAHHIANGDLSQRVPAASRDEIGELAQSFNSMAEALAQQEDARHHLMADIAHELRTPLTVIQASLEAMQDGVMQATPERLASLHEETLLLARLINDLRDLALAEVGQLRLEPAPVDLNELLRRSADQWQPQALRHGVRLSLELHDSFGPVRADAQRLEQVVSNLIDNALRYTPKGGQITVYAGPGTEAGTAMVTVADTGSGIPPEEQPRVFDRFYRGGRAHARPGSGIGLAVVRELVTRHGGRVWVESQPGQGSRFSLTLPLASA